MVKEVGEERSADPPSPPPDKKKSFFGRLFSRSNATATGKEAAKAEKIITNNFQAELTKDASQSLQKKYKNNCFKILNLNSSEDLTTLAVKNGELVQASKEYPHNEEAVLELIMQTRRQAWGKLIDAEHGFAVKEIELDNLNQLNDQLKKICPEALPPADSTHPLKILTQKYRTQEIQQIPFFKRKELQKKIQENETAIKERIETICSHSLGTAELTTPGVNPAHFITEQSTARKIAVKKSHADNEYGVAIAEMLKIRAGAKLKKKFATLAGFNETLISHLNVLLGGRLGIPLAAKNTEDILFAFQKNRGTLAAVIAEESQEFLKKMPLEGSQEFIFSQIISGNTDCHSNNILIGPNNTPIGIDFARTLAPNPNSLAGCMRSAYMNFPCLDEPINPTDIAFYKQLDVDKTVSILEEHLKQEHAEKFNDRDLKPIIENSLNQLKARLIMVKMGVENGLTQRQLLALDFPPIPNEKWIETKVDNDFYIKLLNQMANQGFRKAWNYAHAQKKFNLDVFKMTLSEEINKLKNLSRDELFNNHVLLAYHKAGLI